MTLTKFPNGVSSFGLPVVGGVHISTGNMFFVDSNTGSNSYDGRDSTKPFSTITYALTKCTANKGDIIYAMPGHAEPADVNVNVAGVSIIGIGHGGLRPKLNLVTSACASMEISSCDVLISNLILHTTIDALAHAVEVKADDCTLHKIEWFQENASNTPVRVIECACTANRMTVDDCWLVTVGTCSGGGSVINMLGGDGHKITNNFCYGIGGDSHGLVTSCTAGSNLYNLLIDNNVMVTYSDSTLASASMLGITSGIGSGIISNNKFGNLRGTTDQFFGEANAQANDTFDFGFFNNHFVNNEGLIESRGTSNIGGFTNSVDA